jgi:hypothetical protein
MPRGRACSVAGYLFSFCETVAPMPPHKRPHLDLVRYEVTALFLELLITCSIMRINYSKASLFRNTRVYCASPFHHLSRVSLPAVLGLEEIFRDADRAPETSCFAAVARRPNLGYHPTVYDDNTASDAFPFSLSFIYSCLLMLTENHVPGLAFIAYWGIVLFGYDT